MSDLLTALQCTYWLTDWLADLLTIWLNDWLNDWIFDWQLIYLLAGTCILATSLIDWLSNFLANWLTDYDNWLTWWLTDSLTDKMWPSTGFLRICRNSLCSSVLWCVCTQYHLTNLLVSLLFHKIRVILSWVAIEILIEIHTRFFF